jgi:hypothetical protein
MVAIIYYPSLGNASECLYLVITYDIVLQEDAYQLVTVK